jgi:hypothetical protein
MGRPFSERLRLVFLLLVRRQEADRRQIRVTAL